jgi:hypothetical protein
MHFTTFTQSLSKTRGAIDTQLSGFGSCSEGPRVQILAGTQAMLTECIFVVLSRSFIYQYPAPNSTTTISSHTTTSVPFILREPFAAVPVGLSSHFWSRSGKFCGMSCLCLKEFTCWFLFINLRLHKTHPHFVIIYLFCSRLTPQ